MQCVCDIRAILWDLYILLSLMPNLYEERLSSLFLKKVKLNRPTISGEGLDMLTHMLSVVLAFCWATVSCGNRENFHSYLAPNCY